MRAAHESRAGQLLNQTYELHEQIRATAESEVYRATDRKRHRGVRVELLHAEHALKPSVVARFVRTPNQVMGLRHPNVLRVLAVESDDTGIPFVVEEDVDGELLSQMIARFPGGMSFEDAIHVLWPVAEAIAAAHHSGLVHGQLAPEHVLLARVGAGTVPKVMHFDASSAGDSSGAWTRAPELRDGRAVADQRSDVWALGALAYAMLSGRAPSANDGPRVALQTCAPNVPGELSDLVERCLASETKRRPATARQVSGALSSLRVRMRASGATGPATPLPAALATPPPMPVTPLPTIAWNAGVRELTLITAPNTSEIWGPNDDDLDEALDALFAPDAEAESGPAITAAAPVAPSADAAPISPPVDDNFEFSFDSTSDPAEVDTDPEDELLPASLRDTAASEPAAPPAIVERDPSSPPRAPPSAAASQRAIARSPPPVPPRRVAHEGTPMDPAPVVPATRAPAPSKRPAHHTGKRRAEPAPAGTKTPTATAASAVVRAKTHTSQPSGATDWFRTAQSGRAPARVVGAALATARASLFPAPATPVQKETRRMRRVARGADRSYWSALGTLVFVLFAVGLLFAVPLLADPTREKAQKLLGTRMPVAVAAFAAVTIVSLVRTWALQLNLHPPMLRPVTTALKTLTLLVCLLCATYFLPMGALGPVERAARALLPWVASAFYLFLALHGLALAVREAASNALYALVLALLHMGGFFGSFQVLAVTVLDRQGATVEGEEAEGLFTRLTGRGRVTGNAPDAGVTPPEMPRGTEPGDTQDTGDPEAKDLGIDDLERGRKRQKGRFNKLRTDMDEMTR